MAHKNNIKNADVKSAYSLQNIRILRLFDLLLVKLHCSYLPCYPWPITIGQGFVGVNSHSSRKGEYV